MFLQDQRHCAQNGPRNLQRRIRQFILFLVQPNLFPLHSFLQTNFQLVFILLQAKLLLQDLCQCNHR